MKTKNCSKVLIKYIPGLIIMLILSLCLTGCVTTPSPEPSASTEPTPMPGSEAEQNMKLYDKDKFSISFPETWSVVDSEKDTKNDVVFESPIVPNNDGNRFSSSVSVLVSYFNKEDYNEGKDFNISSYADEAVNYYNLQMSSFELLGKEDTKVGENDAVLLKFKTRYTFYNTRNCQLISYKTVNNEDKEQIVLYTVSFVAADEYYDEYENVFNKMMETFVIK